MCIILIFGVIGLIGSLMFDLLWCEKDWWCVVVLIVNGNVGEFVRLVCEFFVVVVVVADEVSLFVLCEVLVGSGIEVVGGV